MCHASVTTGYMNVHHMRLRAYLPVEQKHFRGKQLSSALLNSQVKVKHRDLSILLRKYPLPFQGLDDRHVRGGGHPHNMRVVGRLIPPPPHRDILMNAPQRSF